MQPHWGGTLTQIFATKCFCFSYEMMLKPMGCHLVPPLQNKRSQCHHYDHLSGKHRNVRKFNSCQRNVRELTKNHLSVRENY